MSCVNILKEICEDGEVLFMEIVSKFKHYDVIFEESIDFIKHLPVDSNVQYVIDKNVYNLYKKYLLKIPYDIIFILDAKEEKKTIDTALDICEIMTSIPAKRNAVIISIGGGIVQDVTGFVANVLYRGIKWIFVPTTLLSACDSCIGGKTSLNYKGYKNLLGTFYPPDEIHICPSFFHTLTKKDYLSGLGEVIKFNLMKGNGGFEHISKNMELLLDRNEKTVNEYIHSSLEFKKRFIEMDEFDKGERIKLNFAHTFGHAIEVMSKYAIPHGTAVAIGMVIANHISLNRGLLSREFEEKSKNLLMKVIDIDIEIMRQPGNIIIDAMRKDKKQTSTALTAVLMTDIPNDLRIVHDVTVKEVENAFGYFVKEYESI